MKGSISRLLSPAFSVIVSIAIIAFMYGGWAISGGMNRNRNIVHESVNVPLTTGGGDGAVIGFNDPVSTGVPVPQDNAPMRATVVVTADGFTPATVTIASGGTVTWTNEDASPHQPDADDGSGRNGFGAPLAIGHDERYRYTFMTPGTVSYHDDRNPTVVGTVVVE